MLTLGMVVVYALIEVYRLSRPTYDFWQCAFNPASCAGQQVITGVVDIIASFVNPLSIIIMAIIFFVVRRRENK